MNAAIRLIADAVAADLGSPPLGGPPAVDQWAQPFVWRDPATLPPRQWLYKPHFIRGFVTVTVAPGGAGKTTLTICEALAVASGKALLGIAPSERARVWLWSGEDPSDEMQRRIQAAMLHHGLVASDVEGWLFTGSGRDADLVIAEQVREGARVNAGVEQALIAFIQENEIGLFIPDPFVSLHRVPENDNGHIDLVAKALGRIAHRTSCAVHAVHHTRKTNGQDATVEDSRGASALLAAARHGRSLNTMTEAEANRLGIELSRRRSFVRIDGGKANLTPPAASAEWFHLVNIRLENGDEIQSAERWSPPDSFAGITPADVRRVQERVDAGRGDNGEGWRESSQAKDAWVGYAVADVLGFDLNRLRDQGRAKDLLRTWLDSGVLVKTRRALNDKGKMAPFVEVGRWVEVPPPCQGRGWRGGGGGA